MARRYFVSERWGGYAASSPGVDALHNPWMLPLVLTAWTLSAAGLLTGRYTILCALLNLLLCRYFFVWMRWRGVLRGMGAPGFITYWMATAVFFLEYSRAYAPSLQPLILWVFQIDMAFIIFSAGLYKLKAGYFKNEGMELGYSNPQWGSRSQWYQRIPVGHWVVRMMNHAAWAAQIFAAVLMAIPATRVYGGAFLFLTFFSIRFNLRLSFLCEMMMATAILFIARGSGPDLWIAGHVTFSEPAPAASGAWTGPVNVSLEWFFWAYAVLLPLTHVGLFTNFYLKKELPFGIQKLLEKYANFFGIIIWRVFSVDLANFYIKINRCSRTTHQRQLISHWGKWRPWRFRLVAEAIAVTTIFSSLKYYPSNSEIFHERLLRYAKTLDTDPKSEYLIFEYMRAIKDGNRISYVPIAEYVVDLAVPSIQENVLRGDLSTRTPHAVSPIFEGVRPGSYLPLHPKQ